MSDTLLVPIDFSASSEAALRWALRYAQLTDSAIRVLHVVHEHNPAYAVQTDAEVLRPLEDAARLGAQRFVQPACSEFSDVAVTIRVVTGVPASRIVQVAEDEGCIHIVMGGRGRSGLAERLLGSKAERVAQLARVPVTIVWD